MMKLYSHNCRRCYACNNTFLTKKIAILGIITPDLLESVLCPECKGGLPKQPKELLTKDSKFFSIEAAILRYKLPDTQIATGPPFKGLHKIIAVQIRNNKRLSPVFSIFYKDPIKLVKIGPSFDKPKKQLVSYTVETPLHIPNDIITKYTKIFFKNFNYNTKKDYLFSNNNVINYPPSVQQFLVNILIDIYSWYTKVEEAARKEFKEAMHKQVVPEHPVYSTYDTDTNSITTSTSTSTSNGFSNYIIYSYSNSTN